MVGPFLNPLTNQIAAFLNEIGLAVRSGAFPEPTFLPNIHVEHGVLLVDDGRLFYPGDLLHEAGHLAVTPSALRGSLALGQHGRRGRARKWPRLPAPTRQPTISSWT